MRFVDTFLNKSSFLIRLTGMGVRFKEVARETPVTVTPTFSINDG
jgi:hypothetical protein